MLHHVARQVFRQRLAFRFAPPGWISGSIAEGSASGSGSGGVVSAIFLEIADDQRRADQSRPHLSDDGPNR